MGCFTFAAQQKCYSSQNKKQWTATPAVVKQIINPRCCRMPLVSRLRRDKTKVYVQNLSSKKEVYTYQHRLSSWYGCYACRFVWYG